MINIRLLTDQYGTQDYKIILVLKKQVNIFKNTHLSQIQGATSKSKND